MRRNLLITLSVTALALLASSCGGKVDKSKEVIPLKDLIGDRFKIGVSVDPRQMEGPASELIAYHFGTMTAENVMKPVAIYGDGTGYNWEQADKIVNFAKEHGMKMRGHTLVWHGSTPRGYTQHEDGTDLTAEELYAKHEQYIKDVMQHFPGDVVLYWDVVNEALADSEGDTIYRTRSPWYRICGPDFIPWAFRTARKYAPENVKLYYNDYNLVDPAKRERAYTLLKSLVDAGVPIDGVGMQAHWDNTVTEEQIQACIDRFSSLGLDIQFTELDLTCFDNFHGDGAAARQKIKTSVHFTPEMSKAQADEYEMFFRVFDKNQDKISSVTFWNVDDSSSWLNGFPIRGRIDYPMLFDSQLQPKEAYYRVRDYFLSKNKK